jgi:hypothetical protein
VSEYVTQSAAILALLRERREEGLTSLDALRLVGSFRLAARIADLHAAGHEITSTMEPLPNGKRIARYRLVEPEPEPVQLGAWA